MKIYLCYVVAVVVLVLSSSPVIAVTLEYRVSPAGTGTLSSQTFDSASSHVASVDF